MAAVDIEMTGLDKVLIRLQRVRRGVGPAMLKTSEVNAHRLRTLIQQHIRALDIVETGAYLRSWSVFRVGKVGYSVGTDRPDSNRHEFGFMGVDSLGRTYHQAPRPHRRPAMEQSKRLYLQDARKVVPLLWGR